MRSRKPWSFLSRAVNLRARIHIMKVTRKVSVRQKAEREEARGKVGLVLWRSTLVRKSFFQQPNSDFAPFCRQACIPFKIFPLILPSSRLKSWKPQAIGPAKPVSVPNFRPGLRWLCSEHVSVAGQPRYRTKGHTSLSGCHTGNNNIISIC